MDPENVICIETVSFISNICVSLELPTNRSGWTKVLLLVAEPAGNMKADLQPQMHPGLDDSCCLRFREDQVSVLCFRIIHCTWVYPLHHYPAFFGYYFFNAMLVVLLCLHLFWSSLILRMIRKFMFGTVSSTGVAAANILSSCFS